MLIDRLAAWMRQARYAGTEGVVPGGDATFGRGRPARGRPRSQETPIPRALRTRFGSLAKMMTPQGFQGAERR